MSNGEKTSTRMFFKIFFSVTLLLCVSACTVGFISYKQRITMQNKVEISTIYNNIYINDIHLGGLTKEDALKKLNLEIQEPNAERKIVLKNNEQQFDLFYKDFGSKFDFSSVLEKAYSYAREGTLKERYAQILQLESEPYKLTVESTYDESSISTLVSGLYEKTFVQPIQSKMVRVNKVFEITEGTSGFKMNTEKAILEIKTLLDNKNDGEVFFDLVEIPPDYKAEDFLQAQSLIGSFSTNYTGYGSNRFINMANAASKINDAIIYPGESFSTNESFGPSTYENGYREGQVIENGVLVDGIGGGVCQVSSTLYNALLFAELEIEQRRNHSLKVGYTDWGFDATLAEGYIDLVFKNTTDFPVFVESYLTENKVIVNLFGKEVHAEGRTLEFKNALAETIKPPAEKIISDPSLAKNSRKVKVSALNGYKYKVYKFVYENGKQIDKVLVNTSTYKARRAEILVGTAEVPASTPQPESILPAENTPQTPTQITPEETPIDSQTQQNETILTPEIEQP